MWKLFLIAVYYANITPASLIDTLSVAVTAKLVCPAEIPTEEVMAVVWKETRFQNITGKTDQNDIGLMQVNSTYSAFTAPLLRIPVINIYDGCKSLRYWRKRFPGKHLCHYTDGNVCKSSGHSYARSILHRMWKCKHALPGTKKNLINIAQNLYKICRNFAIRKLWFLLLDNGDRPMSVEENSPKWAS